MNRLATGGGDGVSNSIVDRSEAEDLELAAFVRRMRRLTGLDLSAYKREQMRRRLSGVMTRTGTRNLVELVGLLERDPSRVDEVRDQLTINVSEFFRDPDRFQYLESHVLPAIIRESRKPVIWSAGCSNGSEPYSLAMILADLMPHGGYRIVASDIDRGILAQARAGNAYRSADVRNVSKARLARHFRQEGDRYAVLDPIKRRIEFRHHNLLADPFERELDLIVCRNVMIYFTEEAKSALFGRMARALREGGVLFIGGTETLSHEQAGSFVSIATGFYRRVSATSTTDARFWPRNRPLEATRGVG